MRIDPCICIYNMLQERPLKQGSIVFLDVFFWMNCYEKRDFDEDQLKNPEDMGDVLSFDLCS